MVLAPVLCPDCGSNDVVKHGQSDEGKQRYKCRNLECPRCTFIRAYTYRGYLPEVKQQIPDMALNGSGIRDTAHVLKISPMTVLENLKKSPHLKSVNETRLLELEPPQMVVHLCQWEDVEAELDEMWSFVGSKQHQRWLWKCSRICCCTSTSSLGLNLRPSPNLLPRGCCSRAASPSC
jgi:insertion element IS1 protein InsB